MNQIGRRGLIYIGCTCGFSVSLVMFAALEKWRIGIDRNFYAAAAQVIPVLLLAVVVRIGSVRTALIKFERQIESERLEALDQINQVRQKQKELAEHADEKLTADMDQLEADINARLKERRAVRGSAGLPRETGEEIAGNLIATLFLGALGIGAALGALAHDPNSGALFLATAMSVAWVLLGLVLEEYSHFFMSSLSEPE
jgi:hypothetical protein